MWGLQYAGSSSLTRDQNPWAPVLGSMDSWPLDHQGSPMADISLDRGVCDNLVSHLLKSFDLLSKSNNGERPSLSHSLPGSVAIITERHLKVTDPDSDAHQVMYILKEDPGVGRLQMAKHDSLDQISVRGPIRSFTQADIGQGQALLLPRLPETPPPIVKWESVPGSQWQQTAHSCFELRAEL